MKRKKGFTLVELLAVIVILAVILVIAMPKISEVIKKTRLSSLEATTKMIINSAEKKYTENQVLDNSSSAIKCSDVAKLNDTDYGTCKITFDDKGNASVILNGKKDGKFDNLTCSGTKGNITCSEGQTEITLKCVTGKSSLTQGDEYVNGQYTYRYKEGLTYNGKDFQELSDDGWSVYLTDKSSTAPVTSELCQSVDDKSIVSMSYMFGESQATSIDLSGFNTSNVTDMEYMFYESQATNLDLSSFNTSNVTDMQWMFFASKATSIDVSNFDTFLVNNMSFMFGWAEASTINFGNKFGSDGHVLTFDGMFEGVKASVLDLSSFDTYKRASMERMFSGSSTTTGYAKTCEDAARFNASSGKPAALTFTVKNTTC